VSQLAHDELFLPSSDDEAKFSAACRPLFRAGRARRASEVTPAKSSPSTQVRNLGLREADAHMDKLLKENWDLKHRITLHDQAFSKLRAELDAALEELERSVTLRERNRELQEAIEMVSRQAAIHEEENRTLHINNAELTALNDDLMREMEAKDDGIQQRQLAIEEAAGIIQQLEETNETLKKQQQHSPRPDSDYFSGEAESTPSVKTSMRPTTAGTCGTDYTNPPDSDYFSADSPSLTPTTPKRTPSTKEQKDKSVQMDRARAMGAAFNREIGLRGRASKDSLLSTFLETPIPESSKRLRRRTSALMPPEPNRGSIRFELQRAGTPPWSNARKLQDIYEEGALRKQIGSTDLPARTGYTPSVTVASVSRSASFEDIYGLSIAQASVPPLSSLATTVSDSAISDTTTTARSMRNSQMPSNPTPVNYNVWPRKLPDWPPSAGLRNRDILFHGTGMDDMFPDSPPRPSSSRESFSSVHLLRSSTSSGKERHARSSSATPAANAVALPPPPPLSRAMSLHRTSASVSTPRRPNGLERSRTLPLQ
jgi:hypothetical protein